MKQPKLLLIVFGATFMISNSCFAEPTEEQKKSNCLQATSVSDSTNGCFAAGVLIVPFKAHLTGNKDVYGSANLGAFIGYNPSATNNYQGTAILFSSYSNNVTSTDKNTANASSSGMLSWGLGVLWPISKSAQANAAKPHVGLILGFDRTSKAVNYEYNNKPWFSILMGSNF